MAVHTILPPELTDAVDEVLRAAGVPHVAHGDDDPVGAASAAAEADARAVIGPFRSRDVADAVEATAPAGIPLLAPAATWVGITRDDEPGCDDAANHRGTVLRMVARDTVVAARIAEDVQAAGKRALVVAGDHEYGEQIDRQLDHAALPRVDTPGEADLVVLCGLAHSPEVERAAGFGLPVVAFSGVEGGSPIPDLSLALPFAPGDDMAGTTAAARAASLVAAAIRGGATGRAAILSAIRTAGPFDEHGDPVDPPVWLYRARADWSLEPDRPL
jgi:hypothetical protein